MMDLKTFIEKAQTRVGEKVAENGRWIEDGLKTSFVYASEFN